MTDLKIEAGKYYRTRFGEKAFVALRNPAKGKGQEVWLGFTFGKDGGAESRRWSTEEGQYFDDRTCGFDLIAEWVEPVFVYVNLYPRYIGSWVYMSRDAADRNANADRTGCVKVNLTDWQGRWDD